MSELQVIPARHGVATFVPAGQTIKIVNTSGSPVVDTWAFALPEPDGKKGEDKDGKKETKEDQKETKEDKKGENKGEKKEEPKQEEKPAPKPTPKKSKKDNDLPSQEDAEKATQDGLKQSGQQGKDAKGQSTPQKNTWSSYVPSLGLTSSAKKGAGAAKDETQVQKNSKTWSSYFPSGKGFSSYIPKNATDTVSSFAKEHQRDTSKSYLEQLQDFSKTPVGAAGYSGLAAVTGSGYGGSLYAGYSAWNAANAPNAPAMEYLSMPHSRAATLHLSPKVNDVLVSNLREPLLTLVEDKSPGIHDTLMAACDPQRYHGLGVEDWSQHGSCAENLVLALKELNERAGLKGAKSVGAEVTINSVPAPLNLFMNIPWNDNGDISFDTPKSKEGDYVRLKAERDVVVVMSACPQDVLDINNKKPTDAHFIVEEASDDTDAPAAEKAEKKSAPQKRPAPKKTASSRAPSTVGGSEAAPNGDGAPAKKPVPKRRAPPAKKPSESAQSSGGAAQQPAKKKPVPKAVQPSKKQEVPQGEEGVGEKKEGAAAAAPPVERKKPRKLSQKPKSEAPKEG